MEELAPEPMRGSLRRLLSLRLVINPFVLGLLLLPMLSLAPHASCAPTPATQPPHSPLAASARRLQARGGDWRDSTARSSSRAYRDESRAASQQARAWGATRPASGRSRSGSASRRGSPARSGTSRRSGSSSRTSDRFRTSRGGSKGSSRSRRSSPAASRRADAPIPQRAGRSSSSGTGDSTRTSGSKGSDGSRRSSPAASQGADATTGRKGKLNAASSSSGPKEELAPKLLIPFEYNCGHDMYRLLSKLLAWVRIAQVRDPATWHICSLSSSRVSSFRNHY
eukprot:scaffold374_cov380-Prasinococcus_capsulatus_cf.AAC.14